MIWALAFSFTAPGFSQASGKPVTAPRVSANAYDAHPKLIVILVLDQFRGDYLERYRSDFKARGFKLLMEHGAYFSDCYYQYANTETAPGHSTIGTGAYTDGHGIGSNEWWDLGRNKDRPITSVEDERYALVGLPAGAAVAPGASPRNLIASTIGDELRLDTVGASRVYGVSLKDRAAILPAGATANGAFWIDQASGRFITSTYYMQQLPDWAQAFDDGPRITQALTEAQAPADTKDFYRVVGPTPAGVSYELDFAKALIVAVGLGKDATTDMLTLSISSTDILGHKVGPDADEQRQMVDAVDADLDSFLTWLDKNVEGGLGNVWIVLTADHGIAPVPENAAKLGLDAARIDLKKLVDNLNYAVNQKFSPGEKIDYLLPKQSLPYLALNQPAFERAGINEQEAEQAVENFVPAAFASLKTQSDEKSPATAKLPPLAALYRTYTRQQMQQGQLPDTAFGRIVSHSYSPNGGWYVMVVPEAFQMAGSGSATTHFTPYSYDRHVPLVFYGAPFAAGTYRGLVEPVDIAPTFASLLGVNAPSASMGRVLTQALKPASEVVYPKPAPVHARAAHRRAASESKQ
ncbi:MAG: alkaline phosphatase family protein [Silvibacterium sp.]|nr:alkaline phosphatase family protein [Silvibacterium sp.]